MVTLLASRPETVASHPEMVIPDDASEFYHYDDNGCEVSESCLDCPLPLCKYDNPVWYQRNRRLARDFRVLHIMQDNSLSVQQTAERFSVTARTVFRIMQRCREATLRGTPGGFPGTEATRFAA